MTNKKIITWTIISVIVLLFVLVLLVELAWFKSKQTYKLFKLEQKGTTAKFCESYYKKCVCYGKLIVRESYPRQYQCNGMKFCEDINETICRE